MKVKYIGDYFKVFLVKGKVYDIRIENGVRIIVAEDGQGYILPMDQFEWVEEG